MKPSDLLQIARDLADSNLRRPRQADLCRAISTTYYALFHCLARTCADMVGGRSGAGRSKPAWRQAYRALQHNTVKSRCNRSDIMRTFPHEVQDFADTFVDMQQKRHTADYDPYAEFRKSDVIKDIEKVEAVIARFSQVSLKDLRAFAIYVLLDFRKT